MLSPATKNLAMLLFLNPQRLVSVDAISEKCGGPCSRARASSAFDRKHYMGFSTHACEKENVVKDAMLLKNHGTIIVILYLWHQVIFQNHRRR